MKKTLCVLLLSCFLLGCASNIKYDRVTGIMTANDYNIVEIYNNTGQVASRTYVPSRFFNLADVVKAIVAIVPILGEATARASAPLSGVTP